MSITETGAIAVKTMRTVPLAPTSPLLARLRGVWPPIGIGLAVIANATWIGFLGYGLSKAVLGAGSVFFRVYVDTLADDS